MNQVAVRAKMPVSQIHRTPLSIPGYSRALAREENLDYAKPGTNSRHRQEFEVTICFHSGFICSLGLLISRKHDTLRRPPHDRCFDSDFFSPLPTRILISTLKFKLKFNLLPTNPISTAYSRTRLTPTRMQLHQHYATGSRTSTSQTPTDRDRYIPNSSRTNGRRRQLLDFPRVFNWIPILLFIPERGPWLNLSFDYLSAIYGVLVSKNNRGATPNHFRRWKICTVLLATAHNGLKSVNLGGITARLAYEAVRRRSEIPVGPTKRKRSLGYSISAEFRCEGREKASIPVSGLSIHQLNKSPEFIPTFLLRGPTDESS
ncbi:hypothetical protein R3P38DRAFT_3601557 [Favolaschia claudopus]|uniref:Ribosomal protein S3 n=1 Tax=Favolaschia claudopus TaxID=2862362 RepID=A0AAW0AC64_9AGAR